LTVLDNFLKEKHYLGGGHLSVIDIRAACLLINAFKVAFEEKYIK